MTQLPTEFRNSSSVRYDFLDKCTVESSRIIYNGTEVSSKDLFMSMPHDDTLDQMMRKDSPIARKFLFYRESSAPVMKLQIAGMYTMRNMPAIPNECIPMTMIERFPDIFEHVSTVEEDEWAAILATTERYIPRTIVLVTPNRPVLARALARACLTRQQPAKALLVAARARSDWILSELYSKGCKASLREVEELVKNDLFTRDDVNFLIERSVF